MTRRGAGLIGGVTAARGRPAASGSRGGIVGGVTAHGTPPPSRPPAAQPSAPAAPTAPFLTPAQQTAKDADYGTYLQNLDTWNQGISDANLTEAHNEAQQQYNAKVAQAQSQAMAAARGIMGSGIATGDLADINTTLVNNLNTLRTNLVSTVTGIQKQIGDANASWNQEVLNYDSAATQNADGVTPSTSPTSSTGGATNTSTGGATNTSTPGPHGYSWKGYRAMPPANAGKPPTSSKPPNPAGNKAAASRLAGGSGFNTVTQGRPRGVLQGTAGGW